MKHIMLDLETLGTRPDAAIISIGAVVFDPHSGELGNAFYQQVDMSSSLTTGTVDGDTLKWWLSRGVAARRAITGPGDTLAAVLQAFTGFVSQVPNAHVWGNGAAFDNVVLRSAYQSLNIEAPWAYNRDRCYRTMKGLYPGVSHIFDGVPHNALDDARNQAKHLCEIFKEAGLR